MPDSEGNYSEAEWLAGMVPDDDGGGFSLLLPFDSDDPEFVRGFNAGSMYGWLTACVDAGVPAREPPFALRAENLEMLIRIAESLGLSVMTEDDGGEHLTVRFNEREAEG